LRRERMYEFLDRLITVAIPRVRDFRGVSNRSFDGRGNFNMGVKEQIIFPEINYDQIDSIRGLDIAITTNARNDAAGRGGEVFVGPTYACRPPGVIHGPFKSEQGCLLFEVHYYDAART